MGDVNGSGAYGNTYRLKNIMLGEHDSSLQSIKYDMVDVVDPIRLAAVGDRYPYHTSTQGVVLYKKRGSERSFLMLHWTILKPSYQASNEDELQTKRSKLEAIPLHDPENTLVSCT